MEVLLIRIDHFHDRALYVSSVRSWLEELEITRGRLLTTGALHLLYIEATVQQNASLIECFATRAVDTNVRDEPCIDRFIDVVARQEIKEPVCKGFLEMNLLNTSLLEQMLVKEWHGQKTWLDEVLATERTKSLLKWREDGKAARRERRKRAAQDRDVEKAAKKKRKMEEEAAAAAAAATAADAADDDRHGDGEEEKEEEDGKSEQTEEERPDNAKAAPSAAATAVPVSIRASPVATIKQSPPSKAPHAAPSNTSKPRRRKNKNKRNGAA